MIKITVCSLLFLLFAPVLYGRAVTPVGDKIHFLANGILSPCSVIDYNSNFSKMDRRIRTAVCLFQKMRLLQRQERRSMFRPLTSFSVEYQESSFEQSIKDRLKTFDAVTKVDHVLDEEENVSFEVVIRIFYREEVATFTVFDRFIGLNYADGEDSINVSSEEYLEPFLEQHPDESSLEVYFLGLYDETLIPSQVDTEINDLHKLVDPSIIRPEEEIPSLTTLSPVVNPLEPSYETSEFLMRVLGVKEGDRVSLYADSTCLQSHKVAFGTVKSGLTHIDFKSPFLKNENYIFYMEVIDSNNSLSSCSVVVALYSPIDSISHIIPTMIGLNNIAADDSDQFLKIPRLILEEDSLQIGQESSPIFQISNFLPQKSTVSLHTDSRCTSDALVSAEVPQGSSSIRFRPNRELEPERNYTFYAKSTYPSGKSSCSLYGVSYQFFKVPKTYVYFRQNIDAAIIPIVMHIEDAGDGDQIKIYANDSSCSDNQNLVVETVLTSSSDYIGLTGVVGLDNQPYDFYTKIINSKGRVSLNCFPAERYLGQIMKLKDFSPQK